MIFPNFYLSPFNFFIEKYLLNKKMKNFVTGGTGYVGKNFINYALKNKHFIYALTRKKIIKKKKLA